MYEQAGSQKTSWDLICELNEIIVLLGVLTTSYIKTNFRGKKSDMRGRLCHPESQHWENRIQSLRLDMAWLGSLV